MLRPLPPKQIAQAATLIALEQALAHLETNLYTSLGCISHQPSSPVRSRPKLTALGAVDGDASLHSAVMTSALSNVTAPTANSALPMPKLSHHQVHNMAIRGCQCWSTQALPAQVPNCTAARARLPQIAVAVQQQRKCQHTSGVRAYSASADGAQSGQNTAQDVIHIRGARFYGYHGVLPAENAVGQPFIVDVRLYCDLRDAGRTDDLTHTVSYADVFNMVRRVVEGAPHALLESVAHTVAGQILAAHGAVQSVHVGISKAHIPNLSAAVQSVGVEIYRTRKDFEA